MRQYANDYQEGHVTIDIIEDDSSYQTDQVITSLDRSSTTIRRSGKAFENRVPLAEAKIPLSDAGSARDLQKSLINENLRIYDPIDNSCVSHVCDILEAGGHPEINRHPISYAKFYKKHGFIRDKSKPMLPR